MSNNERVKHGNIGRVSSPRYDLIDHSNLGGDVWSQAAEKELRNESERAPVAESPNQCEQE